MVGESLDPIFRGRVGSRPVDVVDVALVEEAENEEGQNGQDGRELESQALDGYTLFNGSFSKRLVCVNHPLRGSGCELYQCCHGF
jgi:hypothetical protein